MKRISQSQIADYIGVSATFIGLFRKGKRTFSKQKAKTIFENTGVGFDLLAFTGGEEAYNALVDAYDNQNNKKLSAGGME